jgi:hypothetical protein
MARRILMKFGMDVMPLDSTPNLYFYFPTIGNTNETGAEVREVRRWSTYMTPLPTLFGYDWWRHRPWCHLSGDSTNYSCCNLSVSWLLNIGQMCLCWHSNVWRKRIMKMAVFWVVAPCSLVEVYRRFRGICSLHHQGEDSHLHTHRHENLKSYKV